MRLSLLFFVMAIFIGGAAQDGTRKEPLDPLADPRQVFIERAARAQKEKRFNELKAAAKELAELSRKMSDEIEAGGQDVISARIWENLDRAEDLVKTMRDKAK